MCPSPHPPLGAGQVLSFVTSQRRPPSFPLAAAPAASQLSPRNIFSTLENYVDCAEDNVPSDHRFRNPKARCMQSALNLRNA